MPYVQKGNKLCLVNDTIQHSDTYYAQDGNSLILVHQGTKGMSWGERLYQYKDGSLTPLGKIHYSYKNVQNRHEAKVRAAKRAKNAKLKEKQKRQAEKDEIKKQKQEAKAKKKENKDAKKNSNDNIDINEASHDYVRSRTSMYKLSNKEIEDISKRLRNEAEIQKYLAPKETFGQQLVRNAFQKFATTAVNNISEEAGKKLAANVMKKFNAAIANN